MIRVILSSIILLLLICSISFTQNSFIPLMLDYAFFQGKNSDYYLEVYVSIFQENLQYAPYQGKYRAEYAITTQILKQDSTFRKDGQRTESIIDSLPQIKVNRQFLSLFIFKLPPDDYEAKVMIVDENSGKVGEYLVELEYQLISKDSLAISDIELASNITKEVENSEFNKNTLCVMPNPSNTYSITMPVLYYYTEIYNLKFSSDLPGDYAIKASITNTTGEVVRELPSKTYKKPGKSAVLVDGFNIVTLKGDVYYLNLEITDEQSKQNVKKSKRFTFYKPERRKIAEVGDQSGTGGTPQELLSTYTNYTDEDLDQEFEYTRFISTPQEKDVFKTLDVEAKKTFLTNFWKRHDEAHPELYSSFKEDYFERVNLSNNLFGTGKIKGWSTDRGRVMLIHGKPDTYERYTMEIDKKPYEIWHYNDIEGGVIFIFGDIQGFGEFELLHSTYSRELHNPNWERLVRRAESTGFDFETDFMR